MSSHDDPETNADRSLTNWSTLTREEASKAPRKKRVEPEHAPLRSSEKGGTKESDKARIFEQSLCLALVYAQKGVGISHEKRSFF